MFYLAMSEVSKENREHFLMLLDSILGPEYYTENVSEWRKSNFCDCCRTNLTHLWLINMELLDNFLLNLFFFWYKRAVDKSVVILYETMIALTSFSYIDIGVRFWRTVTLNTCKYVNLRKYSEKSSQITNISPMQTNIHDIL